MRIVKQVVFTLIFLLAVFLLAAAVLLFTKLLILIFKRLRFAGKFKRFCRKNSIDCRVNSALRSIFHRGSSPDIVVSKNGKRINIFIFSFIFRQARYHFLDNGTVEIYKIGRGVIPFLGRAHMRTFAAHPEGITRLSETKIFTAKCFTFPETEDENVLLAFPIPLNVTRVLGNGPKSVYEGDELLKNIKLHSGKGLRSRLTEMK